jgi:hypothetical protein
MFYFRVLQKGPYFYFESFLASFADLAATWNNRSARVPPAVWNLQPHVSNPLLSVAWL